MHKIVILLSVIPWFLYCYSRLYILNNYSKKITISNKLPINNIFLYAILIYFLEYYKKADNIFIVSILLFITIHLFLYFYNHRRIDKKKKTPNFLTLLLLIVIPIILVKIKIKLRFIYYILITISFFIYYIDLIVQKICHEK